MISTTRFVIGIGSARWVMIPAELASTGSQTRLRSWPRRASVPRATAPWAQVTFLSRKIVASVEPSDSTIYGARLGHWFGRIGLAIDASSLNPDVERLLAMIQESR